MTSAATADADGPTEGAAGEEALIDFLSRVPKVALNCGLPCTIQQRRRPFLSPSQGCRCLRTEHYIPRGSEERQAGTTDGREREVFIIMSIEIMR